MANLKIGVVGLGRMGFRHAKNINTKIANAQLYSICSNDKDLAAKAKELNVTKYFSDYDLMIQDPELDAIVIASPSKFHPEQIIKALKAGKHVLTEKPLDSSVDKIENLFNEINKYKNLVFQIGFMRRVDKQFANAKNIINQGTIGKPILVKSFSQDAEQDIDQVIKFGPSSGGQFIDVSVHDIDLMIWYLDSYPKRVWAIGQAYKYDEFKKWNDGDVVSAMVEFNNGAMGILTASRLGSAGYQASAEIIGTDGHILVDKLDIEHNVVTMNKDGVNQKLYRDFLSRFNDAYVNELDNFVKSINDKNYDRSQLEQAIAGMYAVNEIQQSFYDKEMKIVNYPKFLKVK
ncbi:myo-inositol 2-dehydrogenase/D-chiro-inositol 1-dehydrogenase [Mycoplasma testudineum]|uniref:Myo-inositol 2-dehydrogenase/D-chiro-inositol 1-dehydrogenase n=1 Tax=Mycoplasma testudineum TaxID=244584 RepID=A0A4R6IB09_9MOLU|nr:Gfo/Idh/MocA family oxidoreductase [Mycoplasma testudineum]OYD26475.1 dehydrogenase [Mycoplasma testudineum]TDO18964.1 myo-inositol 2-dehydrogenase/D-chiro-inositol 1-dehydrogenase [Mycoplasma testudineum]